ncbi:uncharacterized protein A1O9_09887 [Exophiala aquamarina CBS 119918]|uniref:proline--tRNA ligase n=1 Tax=Exophiala aquamarina CBS 119918 TaxID=1182545 RepID=A0A072P313_9EURO|nr:uncharacterized protein A1O9_09887 [Exophiala aquamarina CBS 119918]KEF54092.1 hypothetical protein A1O9_09887 [Exophiala aquamarina CBS 119918]
MTPRALGRASSGSVYRLAPGRGASVRYSHVDSRQRISNIWIPPVKVNQQVGVNDATVLLTRAGYVSQAYAGIFHMLPLGLRVQEKLENLIDKHMKLAKASKVSLSSISSQDLWRKSHRLGKSSELFMFKDRKDSKMLLSPTHEEEITSLVAGFVRSPKQLPVRLYQIGRKYRDEKRPRGGLLRGREFTMKDLYTFDANLADAHKTYDEVRAVYRGFLNELTIPYIEAQADSGDMGGDLSHEYHFPNGAGEDTVITCTACDIARNEEYVSRTSFIPKRIDSPPPSSNVLPATTQVFMKSFLGKTGRDLVRAFGLCKSEELAGDKRLPGLINSYAVKAVLASVLEVDTGVEDASKKFTVSHHTAVREDKSQGIDKHRIFYVLDRRVPTDGIAEVVAKDMRHFPEGVEFFIVESASPEAAKIDLLRPRDGDECPECQKGKLEIHKAIEIGHTFHLGTRYSSLLDCKVHQSHESSGIPTPVEMGCHGIGVTRLIAAVASCLKDEVGLNWPRVIAPFEAAILASIELGPAAEKLYDALSHSQAGGVDTILDDRDVSLPYKMKDADVVGYPVLIILGRSFAKGEVEVQCRRLKIKKQVPLNEVASFVQSLLSRL